MRPIRLRDFVTDNEGWIYSVATYDNEERVGTLLRYIPDPEGERVNHNGIRYRKVEFNEAYNLIKKARPGWADLIHRIPIDEISYVLKPDEAINKIAESDQKVRRLIQILDLPYGAFGVTGSILCGLSGPESDIDGVVYGNWFHTARKRLQDGIRQGVIEDLDDILWHKIYKKRSPDIAFEEFLIHEQRKWNRGQVDGTYFDLLYTRAYDDLSNLPMQKGKVIGQHEIEALVTGDEFAFDSPAIYELEDHNVSRVLSFTHTYTGQAKAGEIIQARGVLEQHGEEQWLIVGTTREAKGEWIRSLSLLEETL